MTGSLRHVVSAGRQPDGRAEAARTAHVGTPVLHGARLRPEARRQVRPRLMGQAQFRHGSLRTV